MDFSSEHKYWVVKFLELPYSNIDKYVCVPRSWIKTRKTDNKVGVLYPKCDPSTIEKLVLKYQDITGSKSIDAQVWPEYLCELQYNAREYNDAYIYIMMKNNEGVNKGRASVSGEQKQDKNQSVLDNLRRLNASLDNKSRKRCHPERNTKNEQNDPKVDKLSNLKVFTNEVVKLLIKVGELVNECGDPLNDSSDTTKDAEASRMSVEDDNSESDDAAEPRAKRTRSSELPQDYDKNDSRWTLKHRGPGKGLTELLKDSGVYVIQKDLNTRLEVAQNGEQLARLMLSVVFSEIALSICYLSDCKAHGHDSSTKQPELDRNAKDTLVQFVRSVERIKGWNPKPAATLSACIRNKLTEMRKTGKNIENLMGPCGYVINE